MENTDSFSSVLQKLTYEIDDVEMAVNANTFSYDPDLGEFGALVRPDASLEPWRLNEIGMQSLSKYIGGQSKFLISLKPDVRKRVIDTKLAEKDDTICTIRMVKSGDYKYIRAIINKNWIKFDNIDVMLAMEQMCEKYGLHLAGSQFRDYKMDSRFVFDTEHGTENDKLNVGVSIVNDECSIMPLTVDLLIFRQVCANGMIVRNNLKNVASIPHANISTEIFQAALDGALTSIYKHGPVIAGILSNLSETPVGAYDVDEMVDRWRSYYRIPKKITDAIKEFSGGTYYDLVNIITESARDADNLMMRRRGEIAAGNMTMDLCEQYVDKNHLEIMSDLFPQRHRGRPSKERAVVHG